MDQILKAFRSQMFLTGLILLLTAVVIVLSLNEVLDRLLAQQVQQSIQINAEQTSRTWVRRFFQTTPAAQMLIETGLAPNEEINRVDDSYALSEVFRFKTFNKEGRLTYTSDEAASSGPYDTEELNERALSVFQTGRSIILVKENNGAMADYPPIYVETYLPAVTPTGHIIGALELYVDASALAATLQNAFERVARLLVTGTSAVLLLPLGLFFVRSLQMWRKDKRLLELSRFDQLTGVLNRNAITKVLGDLFRSGNRPDRIGMLFVDIDYFKQANDQYGHQYGDVLLKHVATLLKDNIRQDHDIIGRYGGDEFVLLFPGIEMEGLRRITSRLQQSLKLSCNYNGVSHIISLSIGAYIASPADTERTALHKADMAVYEAKRRGRGRMAEYSPELEDAYEMILGEANG